MSKKNLKVWEGIVKGSLVNDYQNSKALFKPEDQLKAIKETLLQAEPPKVVLSTANNSSPIIKTYYHDLSHHANKWSSKSESYRQYSIQDLVTIKTHYYCSPDGRMSRKTISEINLFPTKEDIPQEHNHSTRNKYGEWDNDVLELDETNKKVFAIETWNNRYSHQNYFWVSPDESVIFPEIEKVVKCNGWYFHHLTIDSTTDYRPVEWETIQEVIQKLWEQKQKKDALELYRKKHGDLWLELPWTTQYNGRYSAPTSYMSDKHWIPYHNDQERETNKLLVKFWEKNSYLDIFFDWKWFTIKIDENNHLDIRIRTNYQWNNSQKRWYEECQETELKKGQVFINGKDIYEETIKRISTMEQKRKEQIKTRFKTLKEELKNNFQFSDEEFDWLCKYPGKRKVLSFLSTIKELLSNEEDQVSKEDILEAMREIKYMSNQAFSDYLLLKRNGDKVSANSAKKAIEKAYSWAYLSHYFPNFEFKWHFDDVKKVINIGVKNWIFTGEKSKE